MRSRKLAVVSLVLSLTILGAAADARAAAGGITISESITGTMEPSPAGGLQERVAIPDRILSELIAAPEGVPIRIADWPVAPGRRLPVTLSRHTVVDASSRRVLVTSSDQVALPPSSRVHLWGEIGDNEGRVMLSLDATGARLRGLVIAPGAVYEIIPDGPDYLVLGAEDRAEAAGIAPQPWTCALDDSPGLLLPPASPVGSGEDLPELASGHTATIAFDTDTELMQLKFNNNEAAALDYIADLVAAMNVMYERDLDVTLMQGHTILRVGSDPYNQNSGGAASSAELNEFSSYWSSHYNTVDRALAAMLSGKSPSANSASGIAWVGGLCSHSYGYSFTKVFRVDYLAGDAFVVGHEMGHNFGSVHTHCYNPPIDECYAGESGCYSGSTSCPGGPGTVMSYCHIAGCGSNLMQFHSRVITNIRSNYIAPAVGVCIFASGGGEPLFDDGFESGDTGGWSATGP